MFKKKSLSTAELIESRRKMLRSRQQESAGNATAVQTAVAERRKEVRAVNPAGSPAEAEWIETEWFETRIDDSWAA